MLHLTARHLIGQAAYQLHEHRSSATWSFPQHSHEGFCELCLVVDGAVDHVFPETRMHTVAGDLLLIRTEDVHEVRGRGFRFWNLNVPEATWQALTIFLGDPLALRRLLRSPLPIPIATSAADRARLVAGFADLFARQREADAELVLRRFLVEAVAGSLLRPQPVPVTGRPAWLDRLLTEIASRPLATLDPRQLVRLAGTSAAHLSRSFRRHLGTTPTAWLNDLRLERAALRLSHSDEPILAIALDLGFEHLGYFYRRFSARFGLPPKAYRRRHALPRRG